MGLEPYASSMKDVIKSLQDVNAFFQPQKNDMDASLEALSLPGLFDFNAGRSLSHFTFCEKLCAACQNCGTACPTGRSRAPSNYCASSSMG